MGIYYLIGLSIRDGASSNFYSLWADDETQERMIWDEFVKIIGRMKGAFTIFHYGKFEAVFFTRMRSRYGGDNNLLDRIQRSCFNVLSAITSYVYFPVLSNDLKSVASCTGFTWSSPDASGIESIVWRHKWQMSKADSFKDKLIEYNRDDCFALDAVFTVLRIISNGGIADNSVGILKTMNVSTIKTDQAYRFQVQDFFFPELEQINKCAYFDYQNKKIWLRSQKKLQGKKILRRKNLKMRLKPRINKIVEHSKPRRCARCKKNQFRQTNKQQKDVLDLRFFKGGVKAWNERHISRSFSCQACGHRVVPRKYLSLGRKKGKCTGQQTYGQNVRVWALYNKVPPPNLWVQIPRSRLS